MVIYKYGNLKKVEVPKDVRLHFIDNILLIYVILLLQVTRENVYLKLLIKFVFLIRNYINMVGWDHNKYLYGYGLIEDRRNKGQYCCKNTCDQIPELINNFISSFICLDDEFGKHENEMIDLSENLCYWLYINRLSSYKLLKHNELI
jgi:hypothetical protein